MPVRLRQDYGAGCMSRRIDIELTSARPDGSFTWRAAGAKQPKGEIDASLAPGGAKVGKEPVQICSIAQRLLKVRVIVTDNTICAQLCH